jgi:CheY-like chemotaxis protein
LNHPSHYFTSMQILTYIGQPSSKKPRSARCKTEKDNEYPQFDGHDSNRVLVVDDEPEICRLNSDVLLDLGYNVDVAGDGVAAWELLKNNQYDLMITDNCMPRMSGVELLVRLHNARRFVPAIMTTGTMSTDLVTCQPWFQVITILIKPYTLEELLAAVECSIQKPVTIGGPK